MSSTKGSVPPTTLALRQNDQTLMYVLKETQPSYSKGILDACRVMASIVGIAAVLKMIWSGSKYETRFKSLKQMLSAHKHETLRQQTAQNQYAVLGLDSTASQQQVETAYRQLALQSHPDNQLTKGAKNKATAKFIKVNNAYATITEIKPSTNKMHGGRAKTKMTLSQALQQFKRTFSRKHRNNDRTSKGTNKRKRQTITKTGLRSIKHTVSTENKHELKEALKEIRAHESKKALNACLMLVPLFGIGAVIGMIGSGGGGGGGGSGGGSWSRYRQTTKNDFDTFEQHLSSRKWEDLSIQQLWNEINPFRAFTALANNDDERYHIYIFLTYFCVNQCVQNHKKDYTKTVQKNISNHTITVTFTDKTETETVSFEFVFNKILSYKYFTRLYFSRNGQRYNNNNNHNITYSNRRNDKLVTIEVKGYKKFTIKKGNYYYDPPEYIEVDVI